MVNKRLILTLPEVLRRAIKRASEKRGCSQAEIMRSSLYVSLKDFIEQDNKLEVLAEPKNPLEEFFRRLKNEKSS